MGRPWRGGLLGAAALCMCLAASPASAQYFGRNKVQYDRDRVRVLATDHFDIYYSQEDAAAAAIAGRMAERWHGRLAAVFRHQLRGRQPVVLYGSHRRFEQTNVYGGLIDESTGGFTDSRRRRIVLPFAASLAETDHVLGHEIVHAFQFDIASQAGSALAVPLWFVEGMAEYLTLGAADAQTAMWMRDAVETGKLPQIRALASPSYFPYRWGASVWAYLVERFGDELPGNALRAKRDVARRLRGLTGASLDELTAGWHAALEAKFRADDGMLRGDAGERRPLLANRAGGGRLNLGAALSPDGRRLVFLSERDQFSIDLFLADARTGKVLRKLVSTTASVGVESLQYLHSAGAWDPEGTRFAIATIKNGRAALLIIDVDGATPARPLTLPAIDEVYSPTWSPDGRALAFAGLRGGSTDLYTVDAAGGAVRQLTDDAYADLHPAWSPDGRTIAFATDRFTSSLARLSFGAYRIGLIDVGAGTPSAASITRLAIPAALDDANHLDPAWSPDGNSLFVVADPGGTPNIYRVDRRAGAAFEVTSVSTGVSGVTRVSPALSVASSSGALAFTVYRGGGFEVHTLDAPAAMSGRALDVASAVTSAAPDEAGELVPVPPLPAMASAVARSQAHDRYRPKLSLEAIGTPYFSAGGGPLGSYVSGGASLLFGDLLGDQQLLATGYVSSRVDESSGAALYVNRKSRWNWGVSIEQLPQLRFRTTHISTDPERPRTVTRDRERTLLTSRHVGGFAAYPLNRSQRIELSAGVRQIALTRDLRTETVSTLTGMTLDHTSRPLDNEPSQGVADAGLALVGDTAVFGATGPLIGSRYRLQATGNFGGLGYANVLADYRKYVMPIRPFTIAVRLLHAGRYGGDAADPRLIDAYLGSPTLVRGYGASSVARAACPGGSADCPALNTLLANRFVAAKLELRAPLWSLLTSTSRVRYGPLPMDAFLFVDAGSGWGGEQRFGPGGSDGTLTRSIGGGVRVNVFGLVSEVAAVRPLDLQGAGWSFGFNLRPAF